MLVSCGLPAAEAPTTQPDITDVTKTLMTDSLLWSAMSLYHSPDAVARGGRVLAITAYMESLDSSDWRVRRFLCDVHQTCGDFKAAAQDAKKQLNESPDDYTTGLQWLRFNLDSLNTAAQRITLLNALLDKEKIPGELRAEAAMELARVYQGQGAHEKTLAALEKALLFDPLNQPALLSKLELTENPSDKLKVQTMLTLLRGNPRQWQIYRELGRIVGNQGLFDQAIDLYALAWDVWYSTKPQVGVVPFAHEYLGIMLDAGKPSAAIRRFSPLEKTLSGVAEFESLMVEAYKADGLERHESKISILEESLRQQYGRDLTEAKITEDMDEPGTTKKSASAARAAEKLGWYYMLTVNRPQQALKYARQARAFGAGGEGLDALVGSAMLSEKTPQADGCKMLIPLAEKHPLPAVYLARYYYSTGDAANGEKYLRMGLKLAHSGLAYRKLKKLAAEHKTEIPQGSEAKEIKALLNNVSPEVKKIATTPQDCIKIIVTPTAESFAVGQPIHIKATVENTGTLPVKLGRQGIISQRIGFVAKITGDGGTEFLSLPVGIWQAPRYLASGEKLSTVVRLDVGKLAKFLADNPLTTVDLEVQGLASPLEYRNTVIAREPLVNPAAVIIRRRGLMPKGTLDEYNAMLQQTQSMLEQKQIVERMVAVRRIASLLGYLRSVEQGKITPPPILRNSLNTPALLGLLGLGLRDNQAVVRGEMVASLSCINLNPEILNVLGAVVEDTSQYVRFRMAGLVGGSDTKGRMQLITLYNTDKSKLVRMMAKAFQREHQVKVMQKMRELQVKRELKKQQEIQKLRKKE